MVGDELECTPGDAVALADMGDGEQFHVDDVDVVLNQPRIARCDELSPVPQMTSPNPEESLSRLDENGVLPRGASGIAIMSRCTT